MFSVQAQVKKEVCCGSGIFSEFPSLTTFPGSSLIWDCFLLFWNHNFSFLPNSWKLVKFVFGGVFMFVVLVEKSVQVKLNNIDNFHNSYIWSKNVTFLHEVQTLRVFVKLKLCPGRLILLRNARNWCVLGQSGISQTLQLDVISPRPAYISYFNT